MTRLCQTDRHTVHWVNVTPTISIMMQIRVLPHRSCAYSSIHITITHSSNFLYVWKGKKSQKYKGILAAEQRLGFSFCK